MAERRPDHSLAIQSERKRRLVALLKKMKPVKELFPEIDDPVPAADPHGEEPREARRLEP